MRHEGLVACALTVWAFVVAGCGNSSTNGAAGPSDAAGSAIAESGAGEDATVESMTDGSGGTPTPTTDGSGGVSPDAATADAGRSGADSGYSGPQPPSCGASGAGLSTCGAEGESCCTSLAVEGGTFYRTYDPLESDGGLAVAPDGGPTGLADPATISSFRLDKYLVTVARFRAFVSYMVAGGALPADGSGKHTHLNAGQGLVNANDGPACGSTISLLTDAGSPYEHGWSSAFWSNGRDSVLGTSAQTSPAGWNTSLTTNCVEPYEATWTSTAGPGEGLPINCLTWYQAYAFCIWDGAFLPSEAELEYASAGGSQQREYPWGSADPSASNRYAVHDCDYPIGSTGCATDAGPVPGTLQNIAPVGSTTLGVGRWGQADLAGEAWEWTLDAFNVYASPCTDCAYLELLPAMSSSGVYCGSKATHGGLFNSPAYYLTPSSRAYFTSSHSTAGVGVRCARTP